MHSRSCSRRTRGASPRSRRRYPWSPARLRVTRRLRRPRRSQDPRSSASRSSGPRACPVCAGVRTRSPSAPRSPAPSSWPSRRGCSPGQIPRCLRAHASRNPRPTRRSSRPRTRRSPNPRRNTLTRSYQDRPRPPQRRRVSCLPRPQRWRLHRCRQCSKAQPSRLRVRGAPRRDRAKRRNYLSPEARFLGF